MKRYFPVLAALAVGAAAFAGEAAPSLVSPTPTFIETVSPSAYLNRMPLAKAAGISLPGSLTLPHIVRREQDIRRMSMVDTLGYLTSLPDRRPGTQNGRQTEIFLANAFRALGYAVNRQEVPVNDWECKGTRLEVGNAYVDCSPMPFTTLPATATGRLVYVPEEADLAQLDVRGAIIVSEQRFPHEPVEALWSQRLPGTTALAPAEPELAWSLSASGIRPSEAQAAGAAGLVLILVDQPIDTPVRYWPYQGPVPGVPTVYVSPRTGEQLKEAAAVGANASLELQGELSYRFSQNIIAELEGISSRVYLFQAHHDSPYTGAVDDASSLVALLRLARHYADLPAHQRPGRMVFACTTGHFDGAVGVRKLAHDILPQWRGRYRAVFSLEQMGARAVREENGRLVPVDALARQDVFVPEHDQLRAAVTRAFEAAQVPNVLLLPVRSDVYPFPPGEGGTLCAAGIPTVQLTSTPPYLLTDQDSVDKVDLQHVARECDLILDIIRRMG